MGRAKKRRFPFYKTYYDKDLLDLDSDVPESTKRYRNQDQPYGAPQEDEPNAVLAVDHEVMNNRESASDEEDTLQTHEPDNNTLELSSDASGNEDELGNDEDTDREDQDEQPSDDQTDSDSSGSSNGAFVRRNSTRDQGQRLSSDASGHGDDFGNSEGDQSFHEKTDSDISGSSNSALVRRNSTRNHGQRSSSDASGHGDEFGNSEGDQSFHEEEDSDSSGSSNSALVRRNSTRNHRSSSDASGHEDEFGNNEGDQSFHEEEDSDSSGSSNSALVRRNSTRNHGQRLSSDASGHGDEFGNSEGDQSFHEEEDSDSSGSSNSALVRRNSTRNHRSSSDASGHEDEFGNNEGDQSFNTLELSSDALGNEDELGNDEDTDDQDEQSSDEQTGSDSGSSNSAFVRGNSSSDHGEEHSSQNEDELDNISNEAYSIFDEHEGDTEGHEQEGHGTEGGHHSPDGSIRDSEDGERDDNENEGNVPEDAISGTERFQKLLSKLNGVYSQPIDVQPIVNPSDMIQMVLGLSQRHRWTHQEKEDIMKLINWILGKKFLPDTRYLLDSIFFPKSSITYYFYCSECTSLLGSNELLDSKVKSMVCPNTSCKLKNAISDLSKATYFVCFDVVSQIALLLQDPEIRRKLIDPKDLLRRPTDGVIRDLYDGTVYQKFLSYLDLTKETHYLSVSMSVDGVALFVSSSCSITPCFLMINELPPVLRMEKLILAGLWFGKKVKTDVFLPPIVDKIRHMSDPGFKILVEKNICWHIQLYLLSLVADSGLRYDIQGIHAHRGEFSCSWCLHKGEEFESARKFRFLHPSPPLRTLTELLEDAAEALATKKVIRGVKCLCLLSPAPCFHPIDGMVVDKMHQADEGLAKAFTCSWMGDDGVAPWKIKEKKHSAIDSRIAQIRSPIELRKAVRKLSKRARFTAREWENWTLHFSVPVLSGILKNNYLQHWSLFAQACHLLLQTEITEEELNVAHKLLIEFVAQAEILYGLGVMTFNMHLVTHLVENIIRHGPLFALNAYAFEAGNQVLKKVIFASNGIPHQVCRSICEGHAAQIMRVQHPSDDAVRFLEQTKKKNQALIKKVGKVELLGFSSPFTKPNAQEKWLIDKHKFIQNDFVTYKKIKVNGCVHETFHPSKRTDNSVALLSDQSIIQIRKILWNEVTEETFLFGQKIRCRPSKFCSPLVVRLKKLPLCFLLDVVSIDEQLICVPLSSLKPSKIFVNMKLTNGHSLSPVPNIFNMF